MRTTLSCLPYVHIDLFYQYLAEYNRGVVFISAFSIRVTCPILRTLPQQRKLWSWPLNKDTPLLILSKSGNSNRVRALITGKGGTPATGRRSIRRLDTTIRFTGLQQRWLPRTMMFTWSITSKLYIFTSNTVNQPYDIHTQLHSRECG
jgi:hypothetical protein